MPSSADAEQSPQLHDVHRRIPPGPHILIFDNCSVHRPIHSSRTAPDTLSALPKPAVTCNHHAAIEPPPPVLSPPQEAPQEDYSDIPELERFLEHDDDDDARQFSRCHRESNSWLLFSGVFALIVTLFITNFTNTPHQRATQEASLALVQQLAPLSAKVTALSVQLKGAGGQPYNVTVPLPVPIYAPCLATEIRDVWVPAACYLSLLMTLAGAMVTLQVKSWLMTCSMSIFPLGPIEDMRALRSAAARVVEYKKARKETVARTDRAARILPPLIYSAMALFAFGVVAKIGTFAWLTLML